MPFIPLRFKPGVNRDQTNYAGEGGFYECDKVRFFSGFPQKIGGWTAVASAILKGVGRQMLTWITTFEDNFLAIGTSEKIYIEAGAEFYDITPLRATIDTPETDNCIDTTSGSNTLNINITGHGGQTGDYVTISGVSNTVGGILANQLNTEFRIVSVVDSNNFTVNVTPISNIEYSITATTATFQYPSHGLANGNVIHISFTEVTGTAPATDNYTVTVVNANVFTVTVLTGSGTGVSSLGAEATSTATGGGTAIVAKFQISPGNAYITAGYGWGTGVWGGSVTLATPLRAWGTGSLEPIFLPQRDWWFDNFDNDLVMNIRNGAIYYWARGTSNDPGSALGTPAVLLSARPGANNVPQQAMQILVSQNDKHLIAFGCTPFGSAEFDALLIRWASQNEPENWNPLLPTSSAGDLRVSRGSRIVRAMPTRQEILVFTESHVYSMQYLGTTDVFSLQEYADNISIIGPRAVFTIDNITYWMGKDKFYVYSGRVETLPCTLRNHVFGNLNISQADQVVCGGNEKYGEVWWFYPSGGSLINNSYVVYNYFDKIWYYGTMERTAWLDSPIRDYPLAIESNNTTFTSILMQHEDGVDANGAPLPAYIQSNDTDLGDGERFILTKRIIPDVNFDGSTALNPAVLYSVRTRNFPGSALNASVLDAKEVVKTTINSYTEQIFIRARARQMALRISSDGIGVNWQLGIPRVEGRQDGER